MRKLYLIPLMAGAFFITDAALSVADAQPFACRWAGTAPPPVPEARAGD